MTRRRFLEMTSVLAVAAAAGSALAVSPAWAQGAAVPAADLAVAGPLGDIVLGSPDAKVTIYEYASMTCPHCAAFHETIFPKIKAKYIDTGKVRFVMREFPLDPIATAGFMLARCAGEPRYYAMIDLLFSKQRDYTQTNKPVDALLNLVKQAGFTQEKFESCLKDQKVYDGVNAVRDRGDKILGVRSTPTFFVNGQMIVGAQDIGEFDKILVPIVGG